MVRPCAALLVRPHPLRSAFSGWLATLSSKEEMLLPRVRALSSVPALLGAHSKGRTPLAHPCSSAQCPPRPDLLLWSPRPLPQTLVVPLVPTLTRTNALRDKRWTRPLWDLPLAAHVETSSSRSYDSRCSRLCHTHAAGKRVSIAREVHGQQGESLAPPVQPSTRASSAVPPPVRSPACEPAQVVP